MLVGRTLEQERIEAALDRARGGASGALVLTGEPGSGKSALLRFAIEHSDGMRVLRTCGLESESDLPMVGLNDILRPIAGSITAVPGPQAATLTSALGLGPAGSVDRFTLCAATLNLLAAAADVSPVLVVVDDLHWIDPASAEALLFAARRLGEEGVLMLFAIRDHEQPHGATAMLPQLPVRGLDREASRELIVRASARPVVASVAELLGQRLGGNPMALVTIPTYLTDAQLLGREPLDDPLPIAPTLLDTLSQRLSVLPAATRSALLVAAASTSSDMALIATALASIGLEPADLLPAEGTGVVDIRRAHLEFRHPLLRSAAYHGSEAGARRAAHAALAAALTRESELAARAWHLALAAAAPDDDAADAIEQAARQAAARGAHASAARAFELAGQLTVAADRSGPRYFAGARAYHLAGQPANALRLLEQALSAEPPAGRRAEIQYLRGYISTFMSPTVDVSNMLTEEAKRVAGLDARLATLMLAHAAIPHAMIPDYGVALAAAETAFRFARDHGTLNDVPEAAAVLGALSVLSGQWSRGIELLRTCTAIVPELPDAWWMHLGLYYLTHGLMCAGEYADAGALLQTAIEKAQQSSLVGLLPYPLAQMAELEYRRGHLSRAYAYGSQSLQLIVDAEVHQHTAVSLASLVKIEAAQGREAGCRTHAARLLELARQEGCESQRPHAEAALGLLELGVDAPTTATLHLRRADAWARWHGVNEPNYLQVAGDLVEAELRSGHPHRARLALAGLEQRATGSGSRWTASCVERCRALMAAGRVAEAAFQDAIDVLGPDRSPFDVARIELLWGRMLRRSGQRRRAAELLQRACDAFDYIGARSWTGQAERELVICGHMRPDRTRPTLHTLTARELQVAHLVGQGLRNGEAAATLFLSEKTVEAHLSRCYSKLGIRSRSELAALLAREERPSGSGS